MVVNENDLEVLGTHALTDSEVVLLGEIHRHMAQVQQCINIFLAAKHGYNPDERPIGYRLDFQEKVAIAMSPKQKPAQPEPKLEMSGD